MTSGNSDTKDCSTQEDRLQLADVAIKACERIEISFFHPGTCVRFNLSFLRHYLFLTTGGEIAAPNMVITYFLSVVQGVYKGE